MEEQAPRKELLTFPQLRRRYGLGLRTLRREAARGAFPVYRAGTKWPRVLREEFESWLQSTQVEPDELRDSRSRERCARQKARGL